MTVASSKNRLRADTKIGSDKHLCVLTFISRLLLNLSLNLKTKNEVKL